MRRARVGRARLHRPNVRGRPVHSLTAPVLVLLLISGALIVGSLPAAPRVTEDVEASANPIPILGLTLTPGRMEAKITRSQLGAVSFAGTARVDKIPGIERLIVTLSAVVDTGWPVVISPMTIPFVNPGSQIFQVTVIIPPATSSHHIGTVMVTGSAKAPGLAPVVSTANGVVTVAQFFKLRIETESPLREVSPAETTYNIVNIYNDGNAQDTIQVEIENLEELTDDGWTVLLAYTDVVIEREEYTSVRVTIQTSQDWRLWAKEIHIIIVKGTSMEGKQRNVLYVKSYPIFVYMKGYHIPGFDPIVLIITLSLAFVVLGRARERAESVPGRVRVKDDYQSS